jgi:hypothetical protein
MLPIMSKFASNFVFNGPRASRWQEPTRPAPEAEPPKNEEPEPEDRGALFDLRVRAKAETYIRNGMPPGLAWPRAYRALTQQFDSEWGRRMLSRRAHAAKRRKRAAALATQKKLAASRSPSKPPTITAMTAELRSRGIPAGLARVLARAKRSAREHDW